ncbi:hypothetical protein phiCTP1_gp24 [Clostridium phage phiCTP1]|uniref:hypothetical protein n=1 Tax=Clostridium phage phiCTP1 TaxID=871584 RepID=UPI0001E07826|nr:hypothetical protein phiCTP1_gp24 [Clostridium phage phiCTP1]ADL40325.1 hypothetical phage protein [Clostridium phage phiCTP1]WMU07956.1 hypothetical protein vBCtySFA88_00024 [Clostridium phage vB_CtyS-FA88]
MFNESISINGQLTITTGQEGATTDIVIGNANATIRTNNFDMGIRFQADQTDTIKNNAALVKAAIDEFVAQVNEKINATTGVVIR